MRANERGDRATRRPCVAGWFSYQEGEGILCCLPSAIAVGDSLRSIICHSPKEDERIDNEQNPPPEKQPAAAVASIPSLPL